RKSNYSKTEQWIDKERLLMLKAKMYDRRGKLIKQMTQSDFIQKDGIWVGQKMNMNNVQSKRISTMKLENIALNVPVDDQLMSQRTLTDSAFREQRLQALRTTVK
ncbi:MAG: outer membrane lipoprotein-sorting protein, partial [Gammaproteobacteria bacterium]|nr:outer membrane lipoprotein-sorting protein [Gammaproteobacteria bacterium]